MNFFGDNASQGPAPITVAKMEAEIMTDMFNKMTKSCFKKCVTGYHENDLNVGEMSCVDRCVSKYLEAQNKVGEVLSNYEKQMKAQEAAGLKTAPKFAGSGN